MQHEGLVLRWLPFLSENWCLFVNCHYAAIPHMLIIEKRQCDWGTLSKSFEKCYTFEDALFESEILNPSLKDDDDSINDYLPSPIQLH